MGRPTMAALLALLPLSLTPALGQTDVATVSPHFAVSSIRPSRRDAQMRDMRITVSGPDIRVVNCTLNELLLNILQLFWRSEGGPEWVREQRFDIIAKSEPGAAPDNRVLTQKTLQLLRDRFKLAYHLDSKEADGLALTVGRRPPTLLPSRDGEQRSVNWGPAAIFTKSSVEDLVRTLSGSLNTTVVDRTGLKGTFDFTLRTDDYRFANGEVEFPEQLRSAVERLGFQLAAEKVKVDRLRIDHAELPDEN